LGLRIAAALTPAPRPIGRLDLQGAVNTVRFIETQHRTRPPTGGREGLL
jgi:hypothetical protein